MRERGASKTKQIESVRASLFSFSFISEVGEVARRALWLSHI